MNAERLERSKKLLSMNFDDIIPPWEVEEEEAKKELKRLEEKINPPKNEKGAVVSVPIIYSDDWVETDVARNIISASKMLLQDRPEIKWIVDGILPEQGIVILGGDSGSYKTYLALYLAVCICNGLKFLNYLNTKKGRVLYIDEENSQVILIDRLFKIVKPNNYYLEDLGFVLYKGVKLQNDDLWKNRLEKLIQEFKPDVIIIDSLVRVVVGNENNVEDVRKVFDTIKSLKHKYKICWILLHHTRKTYSKYNKTKDDLRGSGDFAAFADVVIMVNKIKENMIVIHQAKNRLQLPVKDMGIEIIDKDKDIVFEFRDINKDNITKSEQCAVAIEKWIAEKKIDKFTTSEIEGIMSSEYKRNSIYEALNSLVIKERLKKTSRGEYELSKDLLTKY